MALNFFVRGLVLGFSIAAPVGPIGVLCIRRSIADGQKIGLATGLGAASADAIYGCVAAFGLTAISNFLIGQKFWLGFLGGLFLCYLGVRTFLSRVFEAPAPARSSGLFSAFLSTFFLTVTNPMTILAFVAIFAALGLGELPDYFNASALVGGVFAGSALWWLLLSSGAAVFGRRLGAGWMRFLNRFSGTVIFAFGVYSLYAAFSKS
jgi:threonine/homoserine/homoserine lactone efflux protein